MHLHHRRAGTSAPLSVAPRRPRASTGITAALVIASACVAVAVAGSPAAALANRAPVAVDEAFVGAPDAILTGNLKVNDYDPDGDSAGMSFSPVFLPLHGSLALSNSGAFSYTPDPGYVGLDSFTYKLCDTQGACSREATTTFGPGVPLVGADDIAFSPGTPVTVHVLANDASLEGSALTIFAAGPAMHGYLAIGSDGTLIYTPNTGFIGVDYINYGVTDGVDTDSVYLTVTVTNGPPVAHDDTASTPTSTPVTVDVLANDTDPNTDPITIVSGSVTAPVDGAGHATGTAVIDSGAVLYTPPAGFCGSVTFDYQITDGDDSDTDTHTATVTVTVANAPPVAHDDTASTPTNTAVTVDVLANDTDPNIGATGQALATSGLATDHGATVVSNADHTLTITPATGYKGPVTVTYTVADGAGGTDTGQLVVTVRNAPPVAHDDAATTPYTTAVSIPVLDNDTDLNGDAITVVTGSATPPVTSGGATRGTVTVAGGVATYTPPAGFSGVVTFDCTVTDGSDTDTATVTVTVGNAPPVAAPDAATTTPGAPITIDVTGNDGDPDGGTLVVTGFTQPTSGTVSLVGGHLVYTPAPGFSGTVTFAYTATDGQGGVTTGTVTVTVAASTSTNGGSGGAGLARTGTEIGLAAALAVLLLAGGLTLVVAARRRRT